MKTGRKEIMSTDFSERYDEEDDIYYVTFKTGEPSYCVEVDDVLVLEVGIFSRLPTGFRILGFEKNHVAEVKIGVLVKKLKNTMSRQSLPSVKQREIAIERALQRVLTA
jgi:hypothetical protein